MFTIDVANTIVVACLAVGGVLLLVAVMPDLVKVVGGAGRRSVAPRRECAGR